MSLLQYNEIKERKYVIYENEPYEVLSSHVARTQQRKPQNQVKMRSLINGRAVNATFRVSDTLEEAEIEKRDIKFLYRKRDEFWFADPRDPKERFMLDTTIIDEITVKFLKENNPAFALIFHYNDEEKIIGVRLPIKMDFLIKDCPPNIKGDTATGGNKPLTLENGAIVQGPLFLNPGDMIRVNTETGEYVERVEKTN